MIYIKVTPENEDRPVYLHPDEIRMFSEQDVAVEGGLSDGLGVPIKQTRVMLLTKSGPMVIQEDVAYLLGEL